MPAALSLRRFTVRSRLEEHGHGRLVHEDSFEAAAVAWLESAPVGLGGAEISLVVRDVESGCEHCFRLDLTTGEASDCA